MNRYINSLYSRRFVAPQLFFWGLLLIFVTMGCAPKTIFIERPAPAVWADFQASLGDHPPGMPFLISATVNYTSPGQRNRIQSSIWGRTDYAVRMDLSAGLGQTIAMWYEDEHSWEAYFPGENTLYIHYDGSIGAAMLGYPSPLNLRETAMVLLGDLRFLVPDSFYSYSLENGNWVFTFEKEAINKAVIDQQGTLKRLAGHGWEIELDGPGIESGIRYFSRVEMRIGDKESALVRIRSLKVEDLSWEPEQMELRVPPEAERVYLPGLYQAF